MLSVEKVSGVGCRVSGVGCRVSGKAFGEFQLRSIGFSPETRYRTPDTFVLT
jgi:hypothetical protein